MIFQHAILNSKQIVQIDVVFVVKDIIVIFRKIKTILILISFKHYFSHPEKSILKVVFLNSKEACNSGPRSVALGF